MMVALAPARTRCAAMNAAQSETPRAGGRSTRRVSPRRADRLSPWRATATTLRSGTNPSRYGTAPTRSAGPVIRTAGLVVVIDQQWPAHGGAGARTRAAVDEPARFLDPVHTATATATVLVSSGEGITKVLGSWRRSGCGTDPSGDRGRRAAKQRTDGDPDEDVAGVVNAGVDARERDDGRSHAQRNPQRGKGIAD